MAIYEQKVKELEKRIECLTTEYENELVKKDKNHKKFIESLQNSHRENMDNLNELHDKEKMAMKKHHNENVEKLLSLQEEAKKKVIKHYEHDIQILKNNQSATMSELERMQQEMTDLIVKLQNAERNNVALQELVNKLTEELKTNEGKLQELKQIRQKLEEELRNSELQMCQLQDNLESRKKTTASLEELNNKYKTRNEEIEMLLQAAQTQLSAMFHTINVYNKENSDLRNKYVADLEGRKFYDINQSYFQE